MSTAQPQRKFHIWFGNSRTTVTVDQLLFELIAFKLGYEAQRNEKLR